MKNKIFIILFTMAISLSLCACNAKDTNLNVSAQTNPIVETTTQEETSTVEETTTTVEETSTVEETTTTVEETTTTVEEQTNVEETTTNTEEVEQSEYTVEAIDKNMYVKEWCNTYMGPDEKAYELFGECNKGELVHLTGQVKEESNWYEYEVETGDKGFISGDYLVADNPVKQETAQKPSTSEQTPQTPQQTTDTPNNNNGESVTINPKTGEVMKPGDSWVNDAGVETVYGGNSEDYFSNR